MSDSQSSGDMRQYYQLFKQNVFYAHIQMKYTLSNPSLLDFWLIVGIRKELTLFSYLFLFQRLY